jgi:hypothetical protein
MNATFCPEIDPCHESCVTISERVLRLFDEARLGDPPSGANTVSASILSAPVGHGLGS